VAAFWPDRGTLVVADRSEAGLWAVQTGVDRKEPRPEIYYHLERHRGRRATANALTVDRKSCMYAATELGIQVFDPTGRLCGVILPPERAPVTQLAFAGANHDLLYVACGGNLYARKLKSQGVVWPEKKDK
jgi:enterochelin esterase family protein